MANGLERINPQAGKGVPGARPYSVRVWQTDNNVFPRWAAPCKNQDPPKYYVVIGPWTTTP